MSSINSRRRIFDTLICRFKETVAALGRTDDIQVNKVDMTSGRKLAEKDAEISLFGSQALSTCKTDGKFINFNL